MLDVQTVTLTTTPLSRISKVTTIHHFLEHVLWALRTFSKNLFNATRLEHILNNMNVE